MKIIIEKSKNADTRTCDYASVSKEVLLKNTLSHKRDVGAGLNFFMEKLQEAAIEHDKTKVVNIDQFHEDFKNGFKEGHTSWWEMHQEKERHHFKNKNFIQDDVNLLDILEQIADGVMAGMARSGEYRQESMDSELLVKAYNNTIKLLLSRVEVKE